MEEDVSDKKNLKNAKSSEKKNECLYGTSSEDIEEDISDRKNDNSKK